MPVTWLTNGLGCPLTYLVSRGLGDNGMREMRVLTNRFQQHCLISMTSLAKDLGVGMILKGMGRVEPSSTKEIHNFALANFHSTSSSS